MLISERMAFSMLLAVNGYTANTSGFAVFFRNGSSNNVPKSFLDLVATSRAAVEYKFTQSKTEANGQYVREYMRVRSLLPCGGYGAGRTVLRNGVKMQTYAVYPEYTRFTPAPGTVLYKTPKDILSQAASAFDNSGGSSPSWTLGDSVEYDFGRTLHFTNILCGTVYSSAYGKIEYQNVSTGTWTTVATVNGIIDTNFTARRIRYTCTSAISAFLPLVFYAEKGTPFVEAVFTHAVAVPLTQYVPQQNAYINGGQDDYQGIVLDIGTDINPVPNKTGKYGMIFGPDIGLRIADNFKEGV